MIIALNAATQRRLQHDHMYRLRRNPNATLGQLRTWSQEASGKAAQFSCNELPDADESAKVTCRLA